jgi:hypothetical protein
MAVVATPVPFVLHQAPHSPALTAQRWGQPIWHADDAPPSPVASRPREDALDVVTVAVLHGRGSG